METERINIQYDAPHKKDGRFSIGLSSHEVLDRAIYDLESSIPDHDYIVSNYQADRRDSNLDNQTGYLAEHYAREGLKELLCAYSDSSGGNVFVHVDPMPDTVLQAGGYIFGIDAHSGNNIVLNEFNQTTAEYDGVFAIETVSDTGENDVLIVVLESKLQVPRLPRKKGAHHVKRYVDKKLEPLRTLFNTDRCAFVMTTCKSNKVTRNQMRFMKALKEMGGKITTLGVHRSELEALAASYL